MSGLNATELANRLGVSKPRISQYLHSGKLDGCYVGEGRSRRFDLVKVAAALGRSLDLGQMTGNGLATRRAMKEIADGGARALSKERPGDLLLPNDPDRLELATIQIKEEEARRRRRENAREEGLWVLAEEVERHSAHLLMREVGMIDTVMRDGARAVADAFGVDAREVRNILVDHLRSHRQRRAEQLAQQAAAATMTDVEKAEYD